MKKTLKLTDRSLNKILIREAVLTKAAQSCIITSTPARAVLRPAPHNPFHSTSHVHQNHIPNNVGQGSDEGKNELCFINISDSKHLWPERVLSKAKKKKTQTCAIKLETPKFDALTMAAETSISFHTQSSLLFHASHSEYLPPITSAIL